MSDSNKYSLSVVSGGRLRYPRAFESTCSFNKCSNNHNGYLSKDCRHYIVPFNNMLKVYSLETRQCVKTFKYLNNQTLQNIFDNNENKDIEIVHIDFEITDQNEERLVLYTNYFQKIDLKYRGKLEYSEPLKVEQLRKPEGASKLIKVFANALLVETPDFLQIFANSLEQESESSSFEPLRSFPLNTLSKYCWSNNEQQLCVISQVSINDDSKKGSKKATKNKHKKKNANGQLKKITTLNLDDLKQIMEYTISNTTQSQSVNATFISSVAINNEADQVAIGFASGVINLLTLSNDEPPSTRLMKWHIDSVVSLAFEQSGQYLISGGWEKVLCFWSLKNSNTQQFLPRLNGVVVNVTALNIPGYHSSTQNGLISVMMQYADNETMSDYQIIVVDTSDLQSKLSCNGPFAMFENSSQYQKPISAINSGGILKHKLNFAPQQNGMKKKDVTIKPFVIEPTSKNLLYFPHAAGMCVYDLNKNEQLKYQNLSFNVASSMGKVRYEHENIVEPQIQQLRFNAEGNWLVSYETQEQPQGLISSKDTQYALKFWNYNQTTNDWVLQTKISNPHGENTPIVEIVPHSTRKNCLVTCDNQGGLKLWGIVDEKFMRWGLIDMKFASSNSQSSSVSVCFSKDGSLIFQSFNDKLYIMDSSNFSKVGDQIFLQLDSNIQNMVLTTNNENLIICTMTSILCYNLLLGECTAGYDIYSYLNTVSGTNGNKTASATPLYRPGNMKKLLAIDEKTSNVAVVFNMNNNTSKVMIFNEALTDIISTFDYKENISCISWNYDDTFVFVDTQSRIGVITAVGIQGFTLDENVTANYHNGINNEDKHAVGTSINTDTNEDEFNRDLKVLSKKASDFVKKTASSKNSFVDEEDLVSGAKGSTTLNSNTFMGLFDNIENVQMETLFDSVAKILSV
ncbi:hypothetical protein ACO0QE_002430 [Hanseniaspora vineae]